jgi:hypothetical protein
VVVVDQLDMEEVVELEVLELLFQAEQKFL